MFLCPDAAQTNSLGLIKNFDSFQNFQKRL
jgi:hypothetical protein